ncbi:hypothetical protein [Herminiimonas fonticola]|uniref:hypothetical protein n=1 Tax=Herminiimonas fonticola TaxID=303380 RepID=UPI003342E0E9
MQYPNTRYGNPEELRYYTQGIPIKDIARRLKRSEKSIKQWLSLEKKIPYWVPELLRLWSMERNLILRQMGFTEQKLKLGLISGNIYGFPEPKKTVHETDNNAGIHMPDHDADSLWPRQNIQMR